KGLWKIHGTVARWENNSWSLVRADEDGGPVATFRHLSSTRESDNRRMFLQYLVETRPLLVIGYSGSDDFDITRWLKSTKLPKRVLWVQQITDKSCSEQILWSGIDIINNVPTNISQFDRGLIGLACAWNERKVADRLTVL
ncbi:unnamed protein product, partial [Didymodactylos carnosus]